MRSRKTSKRTPLLEGKFIEKGRQKYSLPRSSPRLDQKTKTVPYRRTYNATNLKIIVCVFHNLTSTSRRSRFEGYIRSLPKQVILF